MKKIIIVMAIIIISSISPAYSLTEITAPITRIGHFDNQFWLAMDNSGVELLTWTTDQMLADSVRELFNSGQDLKLTYDEVTFEVYLAEINEPYTTEMNYIALTGLAGLVVASLFIYGLKKATL